MKKLTQTLFTLGAFCAAGLLVHAQSTPKILVVDMAKAFDAHYETQAENAKIKSESDKAQQDYDLMKKEGTDMYNQFKELDEQSKNPTASADAKAKAAADAQKKSQEVQQKVNEMQTFANNAKQGIQQRIQNFRTMMMGEISKTVTQIAKTHNATLVLDKSGPSLLGVSPVIYFDPSYDITDEVIAEINKNRPAGTPAATTPSSLPSSMAPSSSGSPMITVPGVTPGK